jgi:uncharacterized protein
LNEANPGKAASIISTIGSLWLALFLYLLLFTLIADLGRLVQSFTSILPESLTKGSLSAKNFFYTGFLLSIILVSAGYINARNPRIHAIDLTLQGKETTVESLKIVMASDVHLGAIIGLSRAEKLVKQINDQHPDLVLFAGDLVDHNPDPVINENMGKAFEKIQSRFGVYAITGNHEFIGDAEKTVNYFKDHGVTYLQDTTIQIPGIATIIGRDDKDKSRFLGMPRKSLDQLIEHTDRTLPLILLDHQPNEYKQVEENGIDLMLSGHTHRGQLWPFNFITAAMFENHYGLLKKAQTYFYTSCGYGTWGPPVRIGNRPELVVFTLQMKP